MTGDRGDARPVDGPPGGDRRPGAVRHWLIGPPAHRPADDHPLRARCRGGVLRGVDGGVDLLQRLARCGTAEGAAVPGGDARPVPRHGAPGRSGGRPDPRRTRVHAGGVVRAPVRPRSAARGEPSIAVPVPVGVRHAGLGQDVHHCPQRPRTVAGRGRARSGRRECPLVAHGDVRGRHRCCARDRGLRQYLRGVGAADRCGRLPRRRPLRVARPVGGASPRAGRQRRVRRARAPRCLGCRLGHAGAARRGRVRAVPVRVLTALRGGSGLGPRCAHLRERIRRFRRHCGVAVAPASRE